MPEPRWANPSPLSSHGSRAPVMPRCCWSKKRPTHCPASTQLAPPGRSSSPVSSNFPLQDPPVAKAEQEAGAWQDWGWTRAAPSPVKKHIREVQPCKRKGKKTQLGPDRDEQGCFVGVQAGVHWQLCLKHTNSVHGWTKAARAGVHACAGCTCTYALPQTQHLKSYL